MTTSSAPTGAVETPRTTLAQRFEGIPEGDYVRDFLALVLLAVSLALPSTYLDPTTGSQDGVFLGAIAVSAVALAFPYLARFGLLPANWTVARTRAIRILLALPFIVLLLWQTVGVHLFTESAPLGIGGAYALAGAGVALSAQARASELGPIDQDRKASATARLFALAVTALIVIGYVGTAIFLAVTVDSNTAGLIMVMVLVLAGGAVVALPALAVSIKQTRAWVSFVVGLGIAVVAFIYLTASDQASLVPKFESAQLWGQPTLHPLSLTVGLGLFLVPALAAVVSAPAFLRGAKRNSDLEERLDLAAIVLRVMALTGGMFALVHFSYAVLTPSDSLRGVHEGFVGENIAAAIAGVVVAVVAFVALRSFNRNPGTSRPPIAIALGLSVLLAFVLVALSPYDGRAFGHFLLMVILPAIGAYALVGNSASREFFEESGKTRPEPNSATYVWTAPKVTVPHVIAAPATGGQQVIAGGSTASRAIPAVAPAPGATEAAATTSATASTGSVQTASAADSGAVATGSVGGVVLDQESNSPTQSNAAEAADSAAAADETDTAHLSNTAETQIIESIPDESTVVSERVAQARATSTETEAIDRTEILSIADPATGSIATHGYTEAEALDPATEPIVLAKIAEVAPELRPALAKNPTTYPALVEWLGQLGDPAVDAALAERGRD